MPVIPTYDSHASAGVVPRERMTPMGVGAQISSAGATIQGIGEALADIRDRDDIVNAQIKFQRGIIDLDREYAGDTGFGDVRDRRKQSASAVASSAVEGLSDRAKRQLEPEISKALMADEVRFDADTEKREGQHRLARFEENKDFLVNSFVFARDDVELKAAEEKIGIAVEAIRPYLPADRAESFKNKIFEDAQYLRASNQVEGLVRSGQSFDANKYTTFLNAEHITRLESEYRSAERNMQAEARAYYNERIQDHRTVMLNLGKDSGLARELEGMGNHKLASQVAAQDKIDRTVYGVLLGASAKNVSGSINERFDRAINALGYGASDTMAAEKQQAINTIKSARAEATRQFVEDPAGYAVENGVKPIDGETQAQFASRVMDKQRELAGDINFPVRVLTKQQEANLKSVMQRAIDGNNSNDVLGVLDTISGFGAYKHQVLSELKMDSSLHIAMDSGNAIADRVVKLAAIKSAKEVNPAYKESDNIDEIGKNKYIAMLTDRVNRDPSPQMIKYRNDMVELAHKWAAGGGDINELFSAYNSIDTGRGMVVITNGISESDFGDAANAYLNGMDYSDFVPEGNPRKPEILDYLRGNSQLVNAPTSDTRIPSGQRGFYVLNPLTGGVLTSYTTGRPVLISENEIISSGSAEKSVWGISMEGED